MIPARCRFRFRSAARSKARAIIRATTNRDDCHLLVVWGNELYESYHSNVTGNGLQSQCALRWDLTRVYPPDGRGEQCTSADAAGFPVRALLFNADEIYDAIQAQGDIGHAIRFILPNDRMKAGEYVHPGNARGRPGEYRYLRDSVRLALSTEGEFRHRRVLGQSKRCACSCAVSRSTAWCSPTAATCR